jgi:hypothetical protein
MKQGARVIGWMMGLVCGLVSAVSGQTQRHLIDYDYFDREGRHQGRKGWTIEAGLMGLAATPRSFDEAWVRPLMVGDVTVADTVYAGTWTMRGTPAMSLGVGRWAVRPEEGLVDRTGWLLTLGNAEVTESFTGLRADTTGVLRADTTELSGQTFSLRLLLHASKAIAISRDLYVDVRAGLGLQQNFGTTASGPDSLSFESTALPQTLLGVDVGAGIGVRMWSGRHLRLVVSTRALQLAPISSTGKGASHDWLAGSYRPWSVSLNLDLQQPRPPARCGESPSAVHQPGRNLFGPVMRKRFNWSS